MARYDFGLSWREFAESTPRMFQALAARRNVRLRYERFAGAQAAAAIYNVHRASASDPLVAAFDFVADDEECERREREIKFRGYVMRALGHLPIGTPLEKVLEVRRKAIADLTASGCERAEAFVDAIFPHLAKKGEK